MKNRRILKWLIPVLSGVLIIGSLLGLRGTARQKVIKERMTAAQTTLNTFYEHLSSMFINLNYATQLSYICDDEGKADPQVFNNKAEQLLAGNEHIEYLAYFNGDLLETIMPKEEYSEFVGKSLNEFMYSYTLAKVVKSIVVEGPQTLSTNDKEVFLFIHPIVIAGEYKGEMVAAVDKAYVMSQMKLNILEAGGYDYELWTVNKLGEHKAVIAVTDESVDFSQAVKLDFAMPATWNISIQPQNGWLSFTEAFFIDGAVIVLCLLILCLITLSYLYLKQKKELKKVHYMDPDSGLYNYDGFCYFVDQVLSKKEQTDCFILYVHLSGYHDISHTATREEIQAYFTQVYQSIQEDFPTDTIAGKLSEDIITVAVFKNKEDKKIMDTVEDFILQLFWKHKINGKKEFVNPKAAVASYPIDGKTTKELLQYAEKNNQQ